MNKVLLLGLIIMFILSAGCGGGLSVKDYTNAIVGGTMEGASDSVQDHRDRYGK